MPQVESGAALVDLGSWPGGWLQVLADRVGPRGRIVGVDTREVDRVNERVSLLKLDFTDAAAPEEIAGVLGSPADAVLSDAAPALSGIKDVDRAAVEEIHEAVLRVVNRVLRPGGGLVLKAFPGPESDRMRRVLRSRFPGMKEVRPEGKRSGSREFYWVVGGRPATSRSSRRGRRA